MFCINIQHFIFQKKDYFLRNLKNIIKSEVYTVIYTVRGNKKIFQRKFTCSEKIKFLTILEC